jgi:ribosomal protein S27AE
VNPFDYVPVCPRHSLPLHAAEAGYGQCPWIDRDLPRRQLAGGVSVRARRRCIAWRPTSWVWRPRALFNGDDLPPYNGFQPPRTPDLSDTRWQRREHTCPACGERVLHLLGEHRRVCTGCGYAAWAAEAPA